MYRIVRSGLNWLLNDTLFKGFIGNSAWLLTSNISIAAIEFLATILLGRMLGVEHFGTLVLIISFTTVANGLTDLKVWQCTTRYLSEFMIRGDEKRSWAMIRLSYLVDFSTGIPAFLLAILLAEPVARLVLHRPEAASLVQLYAISLLISTVDGTSLAILRVLDRFSWLAVQSVTVSLLKLALLTIIWLMEKGTLSNVLIAYLASSGIGSLILLLLAWKSVKERLPKYEHVSVLILRNRFKEIAAFLLSTNANSLIGLLSKQLDRMVLGYLAGASAVGYYQMAQRFARVLFLLTDPLYFAIYPELSRLWAAGKKQVFRKFVTKNTIVVGAVMIPLALMLILVAPWLFEKTVGREYLPAVLSMDILLIAMMIGILSFWFQPAMLSMGKPHYSTIALGIGVTAQLVSLLVLVPQMNHVGAAVAYVMFHVFRGIAMARGLFVAYKRSASVV